MSSKKSSRGNGSNPSVAASQKVTATTSTKSSILKSSFAPSEFQLSIFASVIQGFSSQQLRIHDIISGRLRCEYSVGAAAQINSLDWGYYGSSRQQSQNKNKKRKRQQTNGTNDGHSPDQVVVALGTSEADIRFFSPSEDKILATLKGGHDREIKSFRFMEATYSEGWSIGGDGKLVQWDINAQRPTRTISLPSNAISVLARPTLRSPQLLCASSIPYAIELADASSQEFTTFDAFRNPIHSIIRANEREESETFLAADSDRYINLYDATSHRLAKTLVAEFGVDSLATSKGDEVLGAITNNGLVQLFKTPFAARSSESDTTPKKSKRQGPSRPNASVRLVRPSSSTPIPLLSASFDGPDLVIAWVESGVHLNFDRIRWQAEDSESLAFEGIKDIVRGKPSSLLNSVTTNGVHDVGKTFVDDSQAVVTSGSGRLVDGESTGPLEEDEDIEEEEEDDDEDDEGEEDEAARQLTQEDAESSESSAGEDEEMVDAPSAPEPQEQVADEEATEPSFGELLASKHTQPIPISTTTDLTTIPTSTTVPATLQSGLSLSTVLTQALRTSDTQLLETCLHTTDPSTIRLTIQRLPSALAATLLSKLADRLSRRPGRYGHLLVWVQWTCVAHGGAIAGRKDVLSKIQSLFSVLNQRAKSLDNLLLLKGKLDMLDAQIGLRRQMMAERAQARSKSANRALEDEEDVIYIEGQDEESSASSSDEDDEEPVKHPRKKALQDLIGDEEDDEDMPMANSVASPSSSNNPQSGMIDDEAEESSAEGSQVDDASSSEEDDDEEEDDSEMNSFINDDEDSISEVEDSEDEITSEPETRPVKKLEGKA